MSNLLSLLKDLVYAIMIEILVMVILKFGVRTKQYFRSAIYPERDEKIKLWEEDLKKLKPKKKYKLERALVKEKIEHLLFFKHVRCDWPKETRARFYAIRNKTIEKLTLPQAKFLFGNLKVNNGIIHIKMSLLTKFDIVCHFTMALLMLFIGPLLLFLSSQITRNFKIGQPLFWVFAGVAIMILVYNLYEGFKKPLLLKRMKQELEGGHIS